MTNQRYLGHSDNQRIRLILENGPFHRQYRPNGEKMVNMIGGKHHRSSANGTPQCRILSRLQESRQRSPKHDEWGQQLNSDLSGRQRIDSQSSNTSSYNGGVNKHLSELDNSLQNGTRLPTPPIQPQIYPIPMRLLWFRANHAQQPKVSTLLNRFGNEGMDIRIIDAADENRGAIQKQACELIILECINTSEQDMCARVSMVRAGSRVPLIVLTDNHTLDWSLLALREGADAIFTLNTHDDIIIARSTALLRRWVPD